MPPIFRQVLLAAAVCGLASHASAQNKATFRVAADSHLDFEELSGESQPAKGSSVPSNGPAAEFTVDGRLLLIGTEGPDRIEVTATDLSGQWTLFVEVESLITGETASLNFVPAYGVSRIDVLAGGGNDHVAIRDFGDPVMIPSEIDAGAGNDIVEGGNGNDLIFGGPGNDLLVGKAGSDVIYGDGGATPGPDGNDRLCGCMFNNHADPWSEHQWVWYEERADLLFGDGGADDFYLPRLLTWTGLSYELAWDDEDTALDATAAEGDRVIQHAEMTEPHPYLPMVAQDPIQPATNLKAGN